MAMATQTGHFAIISYLETLRHTVVYGSRNRRNNWYANCSWLAKYDKNKSKTVPVSLKLAKKKLEKNSKIYYMKSYRKSIKASIDMLPFSKKAMYHQQH